MITFRYQLKNVPMKIAEQAFTAEGVNFPAGFVHRHRLAAGSAVRARGGRSARPHRRGAVVAARPSPTHDADVPRVAIYSQWSGTQELGWYRHAFDQFGIPFDLIFKERVAKGNLKADYDVILMAAQNMNRAAVLAHAGREAGAVHEERQVQVPRHVWRVAGHHRRLRRRRASTRSTSSSTAAAR